MKVKRAHALQRKTAMHEDTSERACKGGLPLAHVSSAESGFRLGRQKGRRESGRVIVQEEVEITRASFEKTTS
jgi:hypothetical protein